MNLEELKKMLRMLAETCEVEINCEDCYSELDEFVDLILAGKSPDEVMPLVEQHLRICGDCKEEFQALIDALSAAE